MDQHAPDLSGARAEVMREVKRLLAGRRVEEVYEQAWARRWVGDDDEPDLADGNVSDTDAST